MEKIQKSEAEWQQALSPEQYEVCRKQATERPFTGKYHDHKAEGTYTCAGCGAPLFGSGTKYDSGSGWPSFWEPLDPGCTESTEDRSLFMVRTEVHCAHCDSHLGHVFDDGPQPTGMRYCVNSASLDFNSADSKESS
jgi:peptide-methionine (R)-S-oxide reductase